MYVTLQVHDEAFIHGQHSTAAVACLSLATALQAYQVWGRTKSAFLYSVGGLWGRWHGYILRLDAANVTPGPRDGGNYVCRRAPRLTAAGVTAGDGNQPFNHASIINASSVCKPGSASETILLNAPGRPRSTGRRSKTK